MLKEKLRLKIFDIIVFPFDNLMAMCIGKDIINNSNIIRYDDIKTDDIVFYEKEK